MVNHCMVTMELYMNETARNEKNWTYNSSEMALNGKIWTYNKKKIATIGYNYIQYKQQYKQ